MNPQFLTLDQVISMTKTKEVVPLCNEAKTCFGKQLVVYNHAIYILDKDRYRLVTPTEDWTKGEY